MSAGFSMRKLEVYLGFLVLVAIVFAVEMGIQRIWPDGGQRHRALGRFTMIVHCILFLTGTFTYAMLYILYPGKSGRVLNRNGERVGRYACMRCGGWMHTEGVDERLARGAACLVCPDGVSSVSLVVGVDVPAGQADGLVDRILWSDDAKHRLDRVRPMPCRCYVSWWGFAKARQQRVITYDLIDQANRRCCRLGSRR